MNHCSVCDAPCAWNVVAAGKRYVVFLQDTNGMSFVTIPSALGASVECAAEVGVALTCTASSAAAGLTQRACEQINSVCLPRKAGEAVGVIAVLTAADGASFTGNIEYNQLDPMLRYRARWRAAWL